MFSHSKPVIEVTAEMGFATSDGEALPDGAGPKLFHKLRQRYPIYERATDVQLQVEMHDDIDAIEARCDRVSYRYMYRTDPPSVMVQLTPGALQLHFVGPYAGWEMMQDIIEREWTTTAQSLDLRLDAYLSLRFVTHLPLTPARQAIAFWLKANPYVPEAMRHTNRGYESRVELSDPNTDITTSVSVEPIDVPVLDALDIKPVCLDVAVRQDLSHRVVRKHFAPHMQKLHHRVREILDDTLSAQAQRYLRLEVLPTSTVD